METKEKGIDSSMRFMDELGVWEMGEDFKQNDLELLKMEMMGSDGWDGSERDLSFLALTFWPILFHF